MKGNCGRILIVDDDARCRADLSALLQQGGYSTREATTGAEGLRSASEEPPALVILADVLPGMTGHEVCHSLREEFGETLPIILLSGRHTEPFDCVNGLLIGADDYIVKPFVPEELLARVRRSLIRSASLRATGGSSAEFGLTPREQEVLTLLADGLTQKTIADQLAISSKTVATHIQRILAKLGVHSRAEAVAAAYRQRWVTG